MKTIIYIMGIDGSGKTTLAKALEQTLTAEGKDSRYLYARYIPVLSRPIKYFLRLFIYRGNLEFRDYRKYSEVKSHYNSRYAALSKAYALLCVLDYVLFTWPKIGYKYIFSDFLIIDRYVSDLVVNVSIAGRLQKKDSLLLLRFLHFVFPKPDVTFFVDVDEEIAFSRKTDIQSVQYLKERKAKYLELIELYNCTVLDGHEPKERLSDIIYNVVVSRNQLLPLSQAGRRTQSEDQCHER